MDIQLQLMSKTSGCKDPQGYISKAFIQKHPNSRLLLREVFYSRSSYASVDNLKEAFSLFSENTRQSSKGKELASYIKEREVKDMQKKMGIIFYSSSQHFRNGGDFRD